MTRCNGSMRRVVYRRGHRRCLRCRLCGPGRCARWYLKGNRNPRKYRLLFRSPYLAPERAPPAPKWIRDGGCAARPYASVPPSPVLCALVAGRMVARGGPWRGCAAVFTCLAACGQSRRSVGVLDRGTNRVPETRSGQPEARTGPSISQTPVPASRRICWKSQMTSNTNPARTSSATSPQ